MPELILFSDETAFLLHDQQGEQNLGINLQESIRRLRLRNKPLFQVIDNKITEQFLQILKHLLQDF